MVDSLSVKNSVFTLEEVLDYKELYEAYPWLAKVQLHIMDVGTEVGGYTDGQSIVLAPYWVYNTEKLRSALLHELQHMVQFAEGFTTGDMPAVMVARLQEELEYYEMELADLSKAEAKTPSEAKALAEAIEVTRTRRDTMARMLEEHRANPHELYMRLAGEIEARNVQARMNMTAEERAKKPFNETLEYRGEAITPITFSLNGKEYFSDKNGNPVSFEELIERSRQGHEELFAELMKAATPEMREAVAKIEAVLSGKLDKSFRYRDLTAEEVEFFESRTGVDFSDYEWRIVPRALLHENKRADNKRGWPLTETELKLLPYFIDSMMQNKETLAVSLGNVNAKGVRSLMVELENPITNTKLVFEASSKKHKRRPTKTKEAPRLSLSSAKMLLIQRAGLAPASTHKSVPSGDFNVAENAGEVKQNLLKQEFSSKDTSINSTKAPAVFGAVEDKLGGWQKGTVNVDIGGGKFDTLTQKLAEKGVTNYIYEPFGRSINANAYILAQLQARKNLGDTATCSNVLNVIKEAEIRANVVHQVAKAIKPDGVAYFTIYEGDKTGRGKKTKDDCWQNNRKTVTYVEDVKQFFGDVELKGGVIVARAPLHVNEPAVWKLGSESETDFVTFSLGMTAEMADIKAAAEAAGTFMKAPNGKPSKLNAVQWMQVRTKAFKRWFGDWENDPANASRVVDENGEPLVVYHGARHAGFRVFDNEEGERRSDAPDGTSFFSSSYGVAASYTPENGEPDLLDESLQEEIEEYGIEDFAGGIYPVFLNIRDPYTINFKDRGWQDDRAFYTLQDETGDYIQPLNGDEYYDSEEEARERAEALGLEEYEIYPEYKDTNSVTQEAMDMGADGAIIENVIDEGSYGYGGISATDYVIFDSTQVKSATQNRGTFDGENADITYSIIGPKALTWDEYADRAFVGRDDGMMRAEIDASQAVLKARMKPESVYKHEVHKARRMLEDGAYYSAEYDRMDSARRLANVVDSDIMTGGKLRDSDLWKNLQSFICSGKEPLKFLEEFGLSEESQWNDILRAQEQTAEEFREAQWQLAESAGVGRESFNIAYENMFGERHDSELHVRTPNDWEGLGDTLGDILDYPEMYAAYPELRNVRMRYKPGYASYGRMPRGKGIEAVEIILGTDKTEEQMRGTLMHEVQHIIQMHEDFAFGGTSSNVRTIFSVLGRLNELGELEDAGKDYKRLSGEIEARGVAKRQFMSLDERLARPFNESLEYPGEALTYRPSEYYEAVAKGGVTYSIIGPSALTWDRYADQAFKGRDDGKLRAEIDSSRARVKAGVFGFDKVKVYRQLIADWGQLPEDERFAVLNYVDLHDEYRSARIAWRDSVGAEAAEAVMRVKHDAAEAAKPAAVAAMESWFAQRGVRLGEEVLDNDTMVKLAESFWYGNADSVVELALTSRDNTARLGDVLDYAELYEAYPQLAEMEVVVRDLGGSYLGQVRGYRRPGEHIVMDMRLLGDWGRFRSVLLHEVQHVVQGIEGYAKGGNKESVYEHMKDRLEYNDWQMQMLARELRWLSGLDYAKDYLKTARRLLKYPNAWKYNGLRYKHWKLTLDGADVARLMVDDIAGQYEELRQADVVETERRNHVIKEAEYVLPEVDFSDISGIERGLAALAKLKPRRSAFRGEAPKKDKRYVELLRYSQAAKNMLKKYKFEPYELYVRLAGEIEARNVQARMDMTASERVARPFNETLEYPGEALVTFSLASQREIIDSLRNSGEYDVFYKVVDRLAKNGKPSGNQEDLSEAYAKVSARLRNDVLRISNGEIDLAKGEHVVSVSHLWHSYYEHCLDYFAEDSQLNLTHDDLRMIPDIVMNYDSVKVGKHNNGYKLEFTKKYGDVEYFVVEDVESKRKNPRGAMQKTIYVKDITKSASDGAFHPTTSSKGYTRTEIVNPISAYIKQNYAEEAKKIAKQMRFAKRGLVAPNGKPSKLSPELWVAVRLQSFKAWFGDWENDPANASKVVDENGEPMVVYHGTNRGDFKEFSTSNQWGYGAAYFASLRAVADAFASPSMGHLDSRVYEVFVNLRNPLVIEADNARYFAIPRPEIMGHGDSTVDTQQVAAFARDNGYDGVIVRDVNESEIITDDVLAFDAKQIKSATDNRGTFDGGNADITYSLSGPSILDAAPTGRMAGEEKMQRLLNYARKEAARWGRTFSKETPNARAAEAMGTVSSLLASIHKELPPMYRPRVESHLRYVEVYARLIESGKIRTYGKLSKEQRAEVEAELMEVLREEQQRVDAEYEQAKAEALQAAALTGEMAALEEAEKMDVEDEVQRAAYLERVAKRAEAEARKRLLAEVEAKKKQLDAEVEALKREFGAEKLCAIAKRMLTDAANSVERYLIDTTLDIVPKLLERLAPKKLPNGKFDKGKMSADGYRKLVRYVERIDSTAEEVAERMEALGLQIAAEEAKSDKEKETVDGDKLEALQAELAEWSTYGNLRGKRLEAVRAGVQALLDFAAYEKNAWQGMLQLKRARIKRQALNAAEALGGADEHKVKAVTEKEEGLLRKGMNLIQSMRSLSQMFYSLGGVPELRALADESLDALSAGHVALTMREKRAYEQLAEFMKKELGLDTENKRNDFMAALKKLHDTGIRKAGELVHHKLKLSPEEAAMWVSMTKEERDAKRAEMEAEAEKHGVLVENVPYEEDIPLLEAELKRYNEKPAGKKWVHTEREFRREGPAETMKLSKDEALNILLLCEQEDYVDAAAENGYTAEVLDELREFVGEDVLAFGHAMREVLENNGLAEVYEAREGVPFPKVENYWPGNFDQSARANEQANALDPTSGNGTRYGMLITRVKHKLRFNILGATNVFMAALAQQNNYIVIGELTAKWRGLLSHSDFAMALKAHMGASQFQTLKELINLLDGAGVQESVTQQALSGMTAMFQSAHAMAVLAGSPLTLIKQVSAMFNAGAWQGISMSRVAARLILDRAGKGAIKYADMMKKDYFQVRYKDNRYFTAMLQLGRDANWSRLSKLARSAMNLIEATDVATNCFAMTALYNITYHDLKHRNKDAVDPLTEEEIHAECDRVVRNTLELGAQPLRRTQKSAFAALGNRNAVVKTLCYMNSEALNKIGMALATMKREGGGLKGGLKAWKYIAAMSFAQQLVIMAIDMWRGAAPIDDDEWAEWALLNLATGASGLGILQTVPVLGEALQWGSGGYIKTGSMGEMVYDFGGMAREMKKGWDLVVFNSEDSVEIKKSRKSPYWQVTYKKQDGSRVTTSTDVPVEGGEFEGVELSKEEAEAKALEVGKRIAEEDAPGWADWGLMGSNLLRGAAAFTGAWRGINSTSKVMSELSGMLQSLNAVGNVVRPFMQAERNEEKREKEFNKKLEKGFREARKKTNERLKKQREEAKKKKEAEKKRKERSKRL